MGRLPAVTSVSDAAGTAPEATGPRHRLARNRAGAAPERPRRSPPTGRSSPSTPGRRPAGVRVRPAHGGDRLPQRRRPVDVPPAQALHRGGHRVRRPGGARHRRPRRRAGLPGDPGPPRAQTGIEDGDAITTLEAAAVELRVVFAAPEAAEGITLTYDGAVVEEPVVEADTLVWRPRPAGRGRPPESSWRSAGRAGRRPVPVGLHRGRHPPALDVPTARGPGGHRRDGRGLRHGGGGRRAHRRRRPGAGGRRRRLHPPLRPAAARPVTLEAVDRAGNTTTVEVVIPSPTRGCGACTSPPRPGATSSSATASSP